MDFLKAIGTAQQLPSSATAPADPFAPAVKPPSLVEAATGPNAVPGVARVDLSYHCQRFYVGRELTGISENGAKEFDDRDETAQLKEIMDRCMRGDAVILYRQQAILADGSVVVWVEWGERAAGSGGVVQPPRADRDYLTEGELRTSEIVIPRAEAPKVDDEDEGPSTADEPDWG